jgi:hypothetical protein
MTYLLEKNDKGFYEIDGRKTLLLVEQDGVVIKAYEENPLSATFAIGDKNYFIENAFLEVGIQEVSELTYNDAGAITHHKHLHQLEIPKDHPITKFLFVSGVSLHDEPYNENSTNV